MASARRLILRYTGAGPMPEAHVARLRSVPGTKVIDQAQRMLLVEGSKDDLEKATRTLDDWVLSPEYSVPVPDTRKKVKGKRK